MSTYLRPAIVLRRHKTYHEGMLPNGWAVTISRNPDSGKWSLFLRSGKPSSRITSNGQYASPSSAIRGLRRYLDDWGLDCRVVLARRTERC